MVDPVRDVLPGTIVHVRLVPFAIPLDRHCGAHRPGDELGRLIAVERFGVEAILRTDRDRDRVLLAFRYPKVASYVVAPFTTQVTKIETFGRCRLRVRRALRREIGLALSSSSTPAVRSRASR